VTRILAAIEQGHPQAAEQLAALASSTRRSGAKRG
jgi:hypothetical protein